MYPEWGCPSRDKASKGRFIRYARFAVELDQNRGSSQMFLLHQYDIICLELDSARMMI